MEKSNCLRIPWINTGHIEPDGSLTRRDMNFITREKYEILNRGKIQHGDFLLTEGGDWVKLDEPYLEGDIALSLMKIRPYSNFRSLCGYQNDIGLIVRSHILRFANASAQPNLSVNSVRLYPVPSSLPP